MSWECECGVVNTDYSVTVCKACETPKGMTWQSMLEHPERVDPQAQAWKQLSDQIGAEFVVIGPDKDLLKFRPLCKVKARVKNWTITLDTSRPEWGSQYQRGTKENTFIQMRAPYVTKDEFSFNIFEAALLDRVMKLFGIQETIKLGDPEFDGRFIVRSNDPSQARVLLANIKIRHLIRSRGWSQAWGIFRERFRGVRASILIWDRFLPPRRKLLEGVSTLHFESPRLSMEIKELNSLFELFSETLNQLVAIGSASEENPNVEL